MAHWCDMVGAEKNVATSKGAMVVLGSNQSPPNVPGSDSARKDATDTSPMLNNFFPKALFPNHIIARMQDVKNGAANHNAVKGACAHYEGAKLQGSSRKTSGREKNASAMDCRLHRSRVLSLHYLSIAQQEELARTPVAFEMKSKFPHRPEITAKVQTRYVLEGDNGLTSTGTRL